MREENLLQEGEKSLHKESLREKIIREAKEWGKAIIIAGLLAILIRIFFIEPYKIPTSSMVPTLEPGDKILVVKFIYGVRIPFLSLRLPGYRKPQRGEVIVFIAPPEKDKCYVKRLVGLPGERVEIENGNIYINGKVVSNPRISKNFYYNQGRYAQPDKPIIVPPNNYFVLGDNSARSRDSRYWGFVPFKNIIGKAVLIWWPPKRVRLIK